MTTQNCKILKLFSSFSHLWFLCAFFTQELPWKIWIPACFLVANPMAMGYNDILLKTLT